jgi:hypothetical protein
MHREKLVAQHRIQRPIVRAIHDEHAVGHSLAHRQGSRGNGAIVLAERGMQAAYRHEWFTSVRLEAGFAACYTSA